MGGIFMKYVCGENYLCFYALMEMILADIGYCNWNQYSLANTFGVVLPDNYSINGVENVETCLLYTSDAADD